MKTQRFSLEVSPSVGAVTAAYILPAKPVCILTLAHGAGAGMDHIFMATLATRLAEAGIGTLRFNFPFAEGKKGRPDTPAVAHLTIAAAIAEAHGRFPKLPLFAAGKSFGGRMTSQYLSENPLPSVAGVIFFGFPLHPAGKPGTERAEHLKKIKIPLLFLQGTRDTLATPDLIKKVTKSLKTASLIELEGADHSFKAGKKDIMSLLVDATQTWTQSRS